MGAEIMAYIAQGVFVCYDGKDAPEGSALGVQVYDVQSRQTCFVRCCLYIFSVQFKTAEKINIIPRNIMLYAKKTRIKRPPDAPSDVEYSL